MWTRPEAIVLLAAMQPSMMRRGWFLALTGGVLTRGFSDHDLDLVAVPMKTLHTDLNNLHDCFTTFGMERTHDAETMRERWKSKGSPDGKYVEVYRFGDKRIDIIVAYPEGR